MRMFDSDIYLVLATCSGPEETLTPLVP